MASKKSRQYPHQWPDGSWHSKSWADHQAAQSTYSRANNIQVTMPPGTTGPPAPGGGMAAPPVTPVAPQPFDADLEQRKITAGMNVGLAGAEAGYQRGTLAYESGYDANGQRNMANPYAQAQLLEDEWKRSLLGARNSYAAQGQYNSGAYGRATAREDRLYAQGSDRLQRSTMDQYHQIGSGQLQTYASNSLGVSGEALAALRRAVYGS